jgi:hypothetical protein
MPEEQPKTPEPAAPAPEAPGTGTPAAAAPAPAGAADKPAATPDNPAGAAGVQAEALSDGTVPTVLATGQAPDHHVKGGRASITSIYRRADIMTTLLTFVGTLIAAGLILGGYLYFTRTTTKPVTAPKVTSLSKEEMDKLGTFFGSNNLGKTAEVLTISSSSLFQNRVAVGSDLRVIGGTQISGPTALADLTVDKVATLGVTNIRGQLVVTGPTVLQSPASLAGGATVGGNIGVSGNGTFGGSLAAGVINTRDISVSGNLNLAGHLAITGQTPSATPQEGAGPGASATVEGNDSGGTITINTGNVTHHAVDIGGLLVTLNFRAAYARAPHVVITPQGRGAAQLAPFITKTNGGFTIGFAYDAPLQSRTSYAFEYWVVQ